MPTVQPPKTRKFLRNFFILRITQNIAYLNGFDSKLSECHKRNDPGNFGRTYPSAQIGQKALLAAIRRAVKLNLSFDALVKDLVLGRNMKGGDNEYAQKLVKRLGNHLDYKLEPTDKLQDLILDYDAIEYVA